MRDLLLAVDGPYLPRKGYRRRARTRDREAHLVDTLQTRTQPSVHAEHPPVHDRAQGEVVEDLTTPPPDVAAPVFPLALVVEPINLGDLSRLVVAPDESHSLGLADFQREQEEEGFNAVEAMLDEAACRVFVRGRNASLSH